MEADLVREAEGEEREGAGLLQRHVLALFNQVGLDCLDRVHHALSVHNIVDLVALPGSPALSDPPHEFDPTHLERSEQAVVGGQQARSSSLSLSFL
jgi:hypothetical protein